jgi:hypothetical protein
MRQQVFTATNDTGQPIQGLSVTVRYGGTATNAPLYSDNGVTTVTQPLTSDGQGNVKFFAADGTYDVVVAASRGVTAYTKTISVHDLDVTALNSSTFAGLTLTSAGTAAAPALSIAMTSLGLFQVSTNVLGFASGGGQVGSVNASGVWTLPAGFIGSSSNDNAVAGAIGEFVTATAAPGAIALTTNVTANVTSISLTAGDWDVSGTVNFTFGATTSVTNLTGGPGTVSATLPTQDARFDNENAAQVPTAAFVAAYPTPVIRVSIAATTTVYLVTAATFTVSTVAAGGTIRARRMR